MSNDDHAVTIPAAGRCGGVVLADDETRGMTHDQIEAWYESKIPGPGFYWAKCSDDTPNEWTVVRVFEEPEGGRWVENTVGGGTDYVHEWGAKLEPPR